MIQSLQTDNDQLKGKFSTLEKDTTNLTNKTQSMTEGAETLSERICTVECINQPQRNPVLKKKCINQMLSKGYDRLTDRMSLQESKYACYKNYVQG